MGIKTLKWQKNYKNLLEKGQKGTERDKKGIPNILGNYGNFYVPFCLSLSLFSENIFGFFAVLCICNNICYAIHVNSNKFSSYSSTSVLRTSALITRDIVDVHHFCPFVQCPSCLHFYSTITTFICTNEFLSGSFK